jgi:hypothetical protein
MCPYYFYVMCLKNPAATNPEYAVHAVLALF